MALAPIRRLGVDGFKKSALSTTAELKAFLGSSRQGLIWGNFETSPYVYGSTIAVAAEAKAAHDLGIPYQLTFDPFSDWAMGRCEHGTAIEITSSDAATERVLTAIAHGLNTGDQVIITGHVSTPDINGVRTITRISATEFTVAIDITTGGTGGNVRKPTHTHTDPYTGTAGWPNYGAVLPAYRANFTAIISKIITEVGPDYLQIGNESDNHFEYQDAAGNFDANASGISGLAELVTLASAAAAVTDAPPKIMTSGWNFANGFMPGYPGAAGQTPLFVAAYLAKLPTFDVLSTHMTHIPEGWVAQIAWVKGQLAANGMADKPLWADDAASGPFFTAPPVGQTAPPWSTAAELALQAGVVAGDLTQIALYEIEHAKYAIRKPAKMFEAGMDAAFMSWDTDKSNSNPLWTHQGFLTSTGVRKAAFYAYQDFVSLIDGFSKVETFAPNVLKFTFPGNYPNRVVVVAWVLSGTATVDLRLAFSNTRGGTVRLRTPVTTIDAVTFEPNRVADRIVAAGEVPLTTTPIFITSETAPHSDLGSITARAGLGRAGVCRSNVTFFEEEVEPTDTPPGRLWLRRLDLPDRDPGPGGSWNSGQKG